MKFLIILCEVIILGATYQVDAQLSDKFHIRHLVPPEGPGYDLFYYDGVSLRDEKWRFDYANRDTAVHRRFGLKDGQSSQFHVVDTLSDANGFRQKSRILSDPASIDSLVAMGVEPPTTLDTFQKYGTMSRIKLRDNSDQEGQPRDPTFGFLNGVTLGVTLNRPTAPGDSYIQGFVSTGQGAQNNRPGLQFGIPNLGILPGSRPSNDSPGPIKSPFSFPFFGNNGGPPPPQSAPPPPPPQYTQPGPFGLPFGSRDPPAPPPVPPSPPQQPSFFAGFQNLNIPFIGQPQTTATTETIIPTTNPSLFANFPNFGFQNNKKPVTTIITTTTTVAPQGPFANLQFPFSNFGQTTTTTTVAPETTTTAQRPFGFNLPIISGLFQNNNGKGTDKHVDNRFSQPGHGHRHPPNHPQNHPQQHPPKHPHRKPPPSLPPYQNQEPVVSEQPSITTEKVMSSSYEYNEFFPSFEDATQKLSEVLTPPPTTTPPNLVTGVPIETGLLQLNAVEPSTDPDIPTLIQKPFVESLVAVVDKNSYALGIQETSTNSFSNVEPVKPFSIPPVSSSRSDDLEQTTFVYIPADSLPIVPQSPTKLLTKIIDKTTTENILKILIEKDQNTHEIISDINDLSKNPSFPTLPSAVEEPPPNALPFPLLDLVPPFETETGDLGIHEDLVLSKISNSESSNAAIPRVPGILELIRQSKENISNEILIQTDAPLIETTFLDQDVPPSTVELKSDVINGINSLEQRSNVKLPETDILPPFENDKESVLVREKNISNTTTIGTSTISSTDVIPPEIDLLPPFITNLVSGERQNTTVTTTTSNISSRLSSVSLITETSTTVPTQTTPIISAVPPEIDLLPPFNRVPVMKVEESITFTNVNTPSTNITTHNTVPTTTPRTILVEVNNLVPPETDLLPPFEGNLVPEMIKNVMPIITTTSKTPTTTTTTSRTTTNTLTSFKSTSVPKITSTTAAPPLVLVNNVTAPEIDLLPPFQPILVADVEEIELADPTTNVDTPKTTTIQLPTTISTTTSPISNLNNVIHPETDLLPPFEGNSVPAVIENVQRVTTTNTPKTTSTTTTTSPRTTSMRTSLTSISIPNITTATPPVSVDLKNVTAPEIDLLPPLQSIPIADLDKIILPVSTKNVNAPTTTTMKSPTSVSPTITRYNLDELNNVIPPETDLLPPFEGNLVSGVTENVLQVTTTNTPKTLGTTTYRTTTKATSKTASLLLVSVNLKNVTAPEVDLLPPFQSIPIADIEKFTLTVPTTNKNTTTTKMPESPTTPSSPITSRISSNELNNVIPPETDLLPPYMGNIVPFMNENVTSKPTSNIPKTTTTLATTTSRTTSTTIFTPTTVALHVVPVDDKQVIVPEIDLLPPFEAVPASDLVYKEMTSTTIKRPKPTITTTTSPPRVTFRTTPGEIEQVPEIDLLPPFETSIFKTPPATISSIITTTPRTTTNKILVTTTTTTLAPHLIIRLPETDLLPPLENKKVEAQTLFSTAAIPQTSNQPTTTNKIPKTTVTTKPRIVTDKKVEPIYQRITTASSIKLPEIDLLSPKENGNNILTATTSTFQPPMVSEIKSSFAENRLSENVPPFNGSNFNQFANTTNILLLIANTTTTSASTKMPSVGTVADLLPPPEGVSKIISTIKPLLTSTIINTTTTTLPQITKVTTPRATSTTKSTVSTTTEKLVTLVLTKPSKFFLPPFETPVYKLELNTSSLNLTERFDDSTTDENPKQHDQSTIRAETDKIVDSVRKIIEHTSQSVLPTVHTGFTSEPRTVTLTPTTRFERSTTKSARLAHTKPAALRTAPNLEARHNKHKFHSHIRHPGTGLIPPPKRNPGQVDVYQLETHISQGGQNLNGPIIYPKIPDRDLLPPFYSNLYEMHASPVVPSLPPIPSTQNPTENVFTERLQTTTEVPIGSVVVNQMTTKAAIKRPVFVNVDEEDDMETTTSILDIKLSPNAIKSLIG